MDMAFPDDQRKHNSLTHPTEPLSYLTETAVSKCTPYTTARIARYIFGCQPVVPIRTACDVSVLGAKSSRPAGLVQ